jgi:hypothetical protein
MQSKTFWKPITENIIFIAQDTTQKHKDYDEQLVETFYLSNTVQSQDLTEIANGLRQVLNLTKVQQLNLAKCDYRAGYSRQASHRAKIAEGYR